MLTIVQEFCKKLVSYYIEAGIGTQKDRGDVPLYVNPKQFHRILKRRVTRRRLEEYFIHKSQLSQTDTPTRMKNKRRRSSFPKSERDSGLMQKPDLVDSASETEDH
jgi:CCAAT-binding transcription factor (CBF-B/NF-YA) subunit B